MEALRNIAGGQNANSKLFKQLLGKDVSEEDMKILEKQAEGLWKKLDDLAENNPNGYQEFIQEQAEAAKVDNESKLDPRVQGRDPGVIVNTRLPDVVPVEVASIQIWAVKAGINIPAATWAQAADRLPPGKPVNLDGLSIPFAELSAPRISEQTVPSLANSTGSNSGSGAAAKVRLRVYTLACHKDTLSKAAASGQLLGLLSEAAMQFVEAKYGTKLDMNARQVQVAKDMMSPEQRTLLEGQRQAAALASAVQGTSAAGLSGSTLAQLVTVQPKGPPQAASDTVTNRVDDSAGARGILPSACTSTSQSIGVASQDKVQGPVKPRGPLIVDMGSPSEQQAVTLGQAQQALGSVAFGVDGGNSQGQSAAVHALQADCLHEAGCDIVRVTVHLPNISRAKDLDLEVVDGQTLTIKLPNGTHFSAAIPKPVQEDSVSAKFDKHAKMLTVTMQCT